MPGPKIPEGQARGGCRSEMEKRKFWVKTLDDASFRKSKRGGRPAGKAEALQKRISRRG